MPFSRTVLFTAVSFNRLVKQLKPLVPYIIGSTTAVTYCYVNKPLHKHHAAMLDFFRLMPSSLNTDVTETYPDQPLEEFMAPPVTNDDALRKAATNKSYQARMEIFIMKLQKRLCQTLEQYESKQNSDVRFHIDRWTREEGGGGISCIMQDGHVFEKAGVNISVVHGQLPVQAIEQMRARGHQFAARNTPLQFFAAGISSVVHPRNPHVPTIHFNYRYFELVDVDGKIHWWYGG
jgi:hypothetical protein